MRLGGHKATDFTIGDEHEYDWKKLSSLTTIRARNSLQGRDSFRPARLWSFLHHKKLKTVTLLDDREVSSSEKRSDLFLAPKFAIRRHDQDHAITSPHFWFVEAAEDAPPVVGPNNISGSLLYQCHSAGDRRFIQSLMSGHQVSETFYVENFNFEPDDIVQAHRGFPKTHQNNDRAKVLHRPPFS